MDRNRYHGKNFAAAITTDEASRSGAFHRGENIVLVVLGTGITWAAAAIQW